MKKKFLILAAIVMILFALDLKITRSVASALAEAVYPVFVGGVFALFLNAPVKFAETTFLSRIKSLKARRALSLTLAITLIAGVAALMAALALPELKSSFSALEETLGAVREGETEFLGIRSDVISELVAKGEKFLAEKLPDVASFAVNTVKEAVYIFIGIALGTMAVASKESLAGGLYAVIDRCCDEGRAALVKGAVSAAADKFSRFLAGQAIEALIFGTACYLAFIAFKVPYALLVAVVVATGNLIPMLGGYIGGATGFLIVVTASPAKALVFIAIILVLQQIEQVTTYPAIVGKYVGLSSFYVLLAVVVGGGLFGFWGLVLGVPVAAFAYNLAVVLVRRKPKEAVKNE